MMTGNELFVDIRPNYAVRPGEVLAEYIAESGWSQKEVAMRAGISEKHLSQVVNGSANISMDVSERLSIVLGTKPGFWIRLQDSYREQVDYLEKAKSLDGEKEWLDSIPFKWLEENGFVKNVPGVGQRALECLKFFAVTSVSAWNELAKGYEFACRSTKADASLGAVYSLIRASEKIASEVDAFPSSKGALDAAIPKIRSLTTVSDPSEFKPRLAETLAKAGVVALFMKFPQKCPLHAITIKKKNGPYIMSFSGMFCTDDQLWFSVFHEIGHIILGHRLDAKIDSQEEAADAYAKETLLPRFDSSSIKPNASDIKATALRHGVSPGIVVGRLQHDGILKYNYKWANDLKTKFKNDSLYS